VVLVRRDTREKLFVPLDELEEKAEGLLADIQASLLEKARLLREAKTYCASSFDEFEKIISLTPGFVKAMWCGDRACEETIKEKTGATARCMPFEQEHISDGCVCCGKKAEKLVYWGKAY
jgi:prolyl-tRNA synthetase